MLESLSLQAKRILELASQLALELKISYIGSECLLLAMFEMDNTVCQFILSEYDITSAEIKETINNCIFLRKHEIDNEQYTTKLIEILNKSEAIRVQSKSQYIYDEHLFYALLLTENTVALKILELLGLVIEDLFKEFNNLFEFTNHKNEKVSNIIDDEVFLVNLTSLARNNKLNPFVGREKYINRIIKILSKKQKNNPLLIGSAGVGKTAIVEGIAQHYLIHKPELNIYNLDLGTLMAGTKYRGDLEQRLINSLKKLNKQENILFIDEIHNILGAGSSEGSLDIANILKPILSRSEIKCIGATTLDEYYKFIDKDKALARRFQNVYIEEPSNEETFEILKGIKKTYEEFHGVFFPEEILEYIIEASQIIHNRKLPDKVIDILDETGYLGKIKKKVNISENLVDEVVFDFLGIDYANSLLQLKRIINFPVLKKYFLRYLLNVNLNKTIVNIQLYNENLLQQVIDDIIKVFNIKNEVIYSLDLIEYQDHHTISSLLGAPPGYIGFDSGGQLSDHILKYPLSIIVIKNYSSGHEKIKLVIENILKEGLLIDFKGREINFQNCIFIFSNPLESQKSIGFNKQNQFIKKVLSNIDVILTDEKNLKKPQDNKIISRYLNKFKNLGYNLNVNFEIEEVSSIESFEDLIIDIHETNPSEKINLKITDNKKKIIINH